MKVVIVGAGVAGLGIGWRLAQAGADVTVLERAQPGRGATWAAAGMIAPTAESGDSDSDEAKFARLSANLWPAFATELEAQSGRSIGYKRDGTLMVALTADEADALARRANSNTAAENRPQLIAAEEARAAEPLLGANIACALWDTEEAQVDNRALGTALARTFTRAGGKLLVNEAVVKIESESGIVIGARTPFALHHADAVVVAAGAWSEEIEMPAGTSPPVIPVKGEMVALTPPTGVALPNHVVWGNSVYLVPRAGRVLVGATVQHIGIDTSLTDEGANWLLEKATGLMPALAGWAVSEHWAGLRPGTPDDLPILGETAVKGLFVATGQFRSGILIAPAVAETMSRLILSATAVAEIRAFDPKRF
jgi:glycine oxidase